jgi:TRAP-type C4-dicarboxylate transport system substrate-binding protein
MKNEKGDESMRSKRKFGMKLALMLLSVAMVSFLGACSSSSSSGSGDEEKITLSYAFFAPDNTFPAVQMKKWAEELEKRTDGKVEVDMFFGGTLLEADNMFDGVANGTADIGLTATTYEPGRFPLLEISDLPNGYPSAEVASQVVADLLSEYPADALKDFKIVTTFATEPAYIQSTKSISNLKELSGTQLRIAGALTPVMKALGAAPVGMAQSEVPEALQTGVVKGNVSSREVLKDLKLAEYVKYVSDYPLTINTFVAVMNKDKWESLPDDVKKVIDELNREMTIFTGKYLDEHTQEAIKWSQETKGLEIVPLSEEETKLWSETIAPINENAVKKAEEQGLPGKEYHERLKELVEQYKK